MFKYTRHSLKKLEGLFKALDYSIRYEKGSFTSGYCIVEDRKIAVVNRFYDTEGRINVLLEILGTVPVDEARLDDADRKFYHLVTRHATAVAEEEE